MSKLIDLTGQTFGRLTVIQRAEDRVTRTGHRIPCWECKCKCGTIAIVPGVSLRTGNTKSCGCLQREIQRGKGSDTFIDLTGQIFGFLTVIERGNNGSLGETRWKCRCTCGNEVLIRSVNLRNGQTRSCGCKKGELVSKSKKQMNQYEFRDDLVIGYTLTGKEFYIDPEDWRFIKAHCWLSFGSGKRTYIITRLSDGKNIFLHRLITGAQEGEVVDHLNHNGCDNRKCNLRVVQQNKNMLNLCVRIDNSSGVPGVSWSKGRNKWEAYISYEGKRHHLGRFDSFDDAVAARKVAEEKYYGPYSYDNSIAAVPRIAV